MKKSTVLFVDDDPAILAGLRRVFRQESYEMLTTTSAESGLEVLSAREVDVVVSDENMPGLSGIEFLSAVSKHYPTTVRIMLTGKANLDLVIRAINEGEIYRFVTKPCNEIELALHIRQAIQYRELLTQSRRMLGTLKMQSAYIAHIEEDNPGILQVARDKSGAVVLPDESCDLDELLRDIERTLDDE